ncbi:MAG: TetR/AcrR family transcriptional regulator [Candidatus Delongbacteria bacterium]|nr:TetR/AcrR family transcriptional regulator [Candidatus Delongbacteria bacterium]MBN2833724.1 TetR/AcrR family transcriptional regulator [Candidatus Delongbacteria bacterium]
MTVGRKPFSESKIAQKRANIIDNLESFLIENGSIDFDITMEDLAKRSRIAKGTIYLYFPTKEELFFTYYLKTLEIKMDLMLEKLSTGESNLTRFDNFLNFYYQFFKQYPHYLKIQLYFENNTKKMEKIPESLWKKYSEIGKITHDLIEGIYRGCIEEGSFREDLDIRLTFHSINTILRSTIKFCLFNFSNHVLEVVHNETPENFYYNLINLLIHGLKNNKLKHIMTTKS